MIENFTPEELEVLRKELKEMECKTGCFERRILAKDAIERLDNALLEQYGGDIVGDKEVIHGLFYKCIDIISQNVTPDTSCGPEWTGKKYLRLKRTRGKVKVDPDKYRQAANAFADMFISTMKGE